ncbi:MAG: hypothetical protein V7736_05900 [Colwellia polaris]
MSSNVRLSDFFIFFAIFLDVFSFYLGEHSFFYNYTQLAAFVKVLSFFSLILAITIKGKISVNLTYFLLTILTLLIAHQVSVSSISVVSYLFFIFKYFLLYNFPKALIVRALLFFVRVMLLSLLIVFFLYYDSVTVRGAIDFAFSNENKLPFLLSTILFVLFLISKDSNKLLKYKSFTFVFLVIASYMASSLTALVTTFLFLFVYSLFYLFPTLKKLAFIAPILVIIFTTLATLKYDDNLILNVALSSRPYNWGKFVDIEELSVLPSQLKISEYKKDLSDTDFRRNVGLGSPNAYFFDNAYINILYRCGLLLSFILFLLTIYVFIHNVNSGFLAVGVAISFQMFTESAIFFPLGGFIIWLVFGVLNLRR